MLDHFFEHDSTGPFICHKLIQRMVTSNPSPRYIRSVVDAFSTGVCHSRVYSGKYGDLGAAFDCLLTDREARDAILDRDPVFGRLNEPWLKVMHMFRALSYVSKRQGEPIKFEDMDEVLGMQPLTAESVFGMPQQCPLYRPCF